MRPARQKAAVGNTIYSVVEYAEIHIGNAAASSAASPYPPQRR